MSSPIAVSATTPDKLPAAKALADALKLDYLPTPAAAESYAYLLVFTPNYLGLQKLSDKKFAPFHIDFLSGKMHYRGKQAGLRSELIARAMGVHPRDNPLIVDATAGLGRDSFILASLGFQLILLERSPIIHALLQDALNRAKQDPSTAAIIERLQLLQTDAIDWLHTTSLQPDVIYLDPMFPERQKAASVKKEMVIMQDLLGKDADSEKLFAAALTCAKRRVVVKRPRLAAMIAQSTPSFSLTGKSSRFDIYLV